MKKSVGIAIGGACVALVLAGVAYDWKTNRSPEALSIAVVKSKLNDPDLAVFRNHQKAKRGGEGVWCGELNARNRMGGMVGFTKYVVAMEPDRNLAVLDQVHFDDGNTEFRGKWSLMCEGA